nr:prepilin-type N-terminal cleavage/methylation domain-containing protein [Bacteriovorax sp. HI3]
MAERKIRTTLLGNRSGFTLIEVMIAIAIFAVFASAFVTGFGYNLIDSGKLKEDMLLKDFCENKINEIITNPPALSDSLTLTKDTKDVENNNNYQTIVEYKKFFVPDMSKIESSADLEQSQEESQEKQLEKRIFTVFKENMEKMIWQVEVTVKNKSSGETYKLDAWIMNQNADVAIGSF